MEQHPTFPRDLIRTQRQRARTYAALERRPLQTAALRRQLQQLDNRITAHPFWRTTAGRSPSAKIALRDLVREIEAAEELLSDQQRRILAFIRRWAAEHDGKTPSVREIGRSMGLSSTGSVAYQLGQMERLGVLDRSDRRGPGKGIALLW
ncbi:LexA family protein [Streptomyces sp. NPDC096013]|uniref:LexA family protein n=1 Tax=Streptomyces sp. NPDC096013 TaxID=3366069 RepID=UPI0037FEF3F4